MTEQNPFIERQLTPLEIKERTAIALDLMEERDDIVSSIDEKRREIKELNVDKDRLDARIAQLRREVRNGKVLEPRQTSMPFTAKVLEPEPDAPLKPARSRKKKPEAEAE